MSHYVIKGRLQLLYILSMHTQADFAPVNACQTSLPKNYIRVANSRTLPGITLIFFIIFWLQKQCLAISNYYDDFVTWVISFWKSPYGIKIRVWFTHTISLFVRHFGFSILDHRGSSRIFWWPRKYALELAWYELMETIELFLLIIFVTVLNASIGLHF